MVMHARKPQRISDGYFEKHQSHPYQKYNSKSERRTTNEYVSSENRYTPLRSPNGNVSVHGHNTHSSQSGHGHHHYSHVADDRGYPSSRNAYLQKGSEKERDRDYKSSRNKYTDSVRSPKERSKDSERERSNHERNEHDKKNRTSGMNISVSRSSKYDKRSAPSASVSSGREWSEHISSSGKKYYYNCISEVSQWEKPREWDSRRTSSKDSTYSSRSIDATREQCEARTSHARHQYGDVNPGGISGAVAERHHPSELKAPYDMHMTGRDKRSSSRSGRREIEKSSKRTNSASERYWNSSREEEVHDRTRPKHSATPHDGKDGQSLQDMDISPDRSTPLSENSYGAREAAIVRNNAENSAVPPVVVLDNSNQQTGSLLAAALPRIVAVQPQVTIPPANNNGATASPIGICDGNRSGSGTPHRDPGPPTPTHSENIDPHAPPLHLDTALPRKMECLGSYSQVVGGTLHHAPPMLTPSLVNYVRSDLTSHVTGWPADILEKQANKFTEEAYQLGCLQCTRVSAELKCSRSLVRHTEIRATLQEQKIMYLRQQISRLEELKSQNSFMSED